MARKRFLGCWIVCCLKSGGGGGGGDFGADN